MYYIINFIGWLRTSCQDAYSGYTKRKYFILDYPGLSHVISKSLRTEKQAKNKKPKVHKNRSYYQPSKVEKPRKNFMDHSIYHEQEYLVVYEPILR